MARVPLYKAAETEMLRRIRVGEWPVGERLQNEFELANEFGVSQGTMRRSLMTLESMGLLSRKPGRGTIVAAKNRTPAAAGGMPAGFDRLTEADGTPMAPEVFRARSGTRGADDTEAELFKTGRLSVLERTLKREGERFALDKVIVPETVIAALPEDGPVDIAALLTEAGFTVSQVEDHVSAGITTMSDAVALSVDRHTALLVLTRVARDANGRALGRQVLRTVAGPVGYGVVLTA